MRGIIFRTYLNFVNDKFGYTKLDEILQKDEYPNKGGFSSAGNYDSSYLMSLVSNTAYLFDNSIDKVVNAFGEYAFKFLLDKFKRTYGDTDTPLHVKNAYDFLENLNIIHFDELQKIYPDAIFPKFDINRIDVEHITIEYASPRNLPYFVCGLIRGCLNYYNDKSLLSLEETDRYKIIDNKKCTVYRFEVKSNG